MGVAQVSQGQCLAEAVADVAVEVEFLAVQGFGARVVAQHPPGVAQAVEGVGLAAAVADFAIQLKRRS